ncbi:MAG: tryptophan synthase subunit alpha [Sutterellaceae bacterium]|nr:tryptophan synthase subunit alpha [Burkholderiaceae bacterium]MCX7901165.1 tryptophan synthase subunit alpha [Burkholderiaceae bacterium]MDW8430717.1 tryptophan synthase subunit alpha [Sutterellaceae bacterium]
MSRLASCFAALQQAGRKGLIPFLTAGDPAPELTIPLMHAMVAAGADIIELGVPFSDPMADGPTIQRSTQRAIANGGGLRQTLALAQEFRRTDARTPLVLMGYANPIEAMGVDAFTRAARAADIDGVLVVDYPPEECEAFAAALRAVQIDPIFLLAPTSTLQRIARIGQIASGYVYYVSLKGTTGAGHLDVSDVVARIPRLREQVRVPIGVGFGIRDAQSAAAVAQVADAVVVGSRIIEEIERTPRERLVEAVRTLLTDMRQAIDVATAGRAAHENRRAR